MSRIVIDDEISLDEGELEFQYVRSSGPGGQNVNKVATAVKLRWDVAGTTSLPEDVKARLIRLAGKRMTEEGALVLDARRYRTRERNRKDAVDRLVALVRRALEPPKPRKPTRPTRASRQRRLAQKQRRSEVKRQRGRVEPED